MEGWAGVSELQLVLAGFSLLLAAQQASVWRWEGAGSSARLMVFTAAATAAVFVAGHAAVWALDNPRHLDTLLFVRSATLVVLALSTLPLAGSVSTRKPPRWLIAAVGLIGGTRLALWPGTDLVYRHQTVEGLPSYGPLMVPLGLAMIVLVFGYLCLSAVGKGPSDGERLGLIAGLCLSLCLAVVSLGSSSPVADEVLTGYVPFPALLAMGVMLWTRQLRAFRTVRCLADRQRVLAGLGTFALTADLPAVIAAAQEVVADQGQFSESEQHGEFLVAVGALVTAARDRDHANDELRRQATTDELTGLANRSRLTEVIDAALGRDSDPSAIAIALCDIDRFRSLNEVHGHATGDEVLRQIARRLSDVAQPCDVVGRVGSDEFVVVCTDTAGSDVAAFGQRLSGAFARPFETRNIDAKVTASIGIVTATGRDRGASNGETLLRDAGTAMHDAKARGGGGIGEFHDGLRSAVVFRADLERRLTGAAARGEIVVHYQPILSLPLRRVVAFEALARWRLGNTLLAPDQWIPVAESTGLINEIGESVLRQAVDQLQHWVGLGHDISMSVNVSPRQLSSRHFPDAVRACLTSGLPPERLGLEVTESLAVDEHAAGVLGDLRRSGVQIALDDFGTGYSALAAVSRLPIDILKVDRSIVRRANDRDGAAVLSAVVAMAESLQLRVVAEGVETHEHEAALNRLACHFGQGYLYSRPVDARAAGEQLGTVNAGFADPIRAEPGPLSPRPPEG